MTIAHDSSANPTPNAAKRSTILDRFEEAWERGEQPEIEAFLPSEPDLRGPVLRDLVHIDLERRVKAGESIQVEDYVKRFPELAQDPAMVQALNTLREDLLVPPRKEDYTLPYLGPVPVTGSPFGRYQILKELPAGGMGKVFVAHDTELERQVALKIPRLTGADAAVRQRFLQEARAAANLNHPHICPVYDVSEWEGVPYLTMAYIEGRSLKEEMQEQPLLPRQAAELVHRLALALEEAHRHNVVHRDLKPSNIMINRRGEPVIVDFGVARRLRPGQESSTLPGQPLGTPAYMPPEQVKGSIKEMGPRSDIYSLGVSLYEMLTGRLPFTGSWTEVMAKVLTEPPPPPSQFRPDLDPILEKICLQAMAKRIEDRFASMVEFARALKDWLGYTIQPALRSGATAPAPAAPPDPRVAEDILKLLRRWGWDMGLEKLKTTIRGTTDAGERGRLQILLGWVAGERGHYLEALRQLRAVEALPGLAAWGLAGQAFVALRERSHVAAGELLAAAVARADPNDTVLLATVAHLRGTLAYHEGRYDQALAELHGALEQFGPAHYGTGRVLDTLGMLHASRDNFPIARLFYTKALEAKHHFNDDAGITLTHGQLGRFYLDWGQLDQADTHLRRGIEIARRIGDQRGEAQLYNHRGQVMLARGRLTEATTLLDESIRGSRERFPVVEGYARKDRALAHLAQGKPAEAERECEQSEVLFQKQSFAEGMAHVWHVRGLIRRAQGNLDEAARWLERALAHFEENNERSEAARTRRELAQTLRAQEAPALLISQCYLAALDAAEQSRHDQLVAAIENDLRQVAELELARRHLRRLRGASASDNATELVGGTAEVATVLFLDLRVNAGGEDPAEQMRLRNHFCADLEPVLQAAGVTLSQYRGDGAMALFQGPDHARRAVTAALALVQAVAEFNRPRRVLGWPLWTVHAGLSSGTVAAGSLGTYQKLDWSATGPPIREAAALLADSHADVPCLSESTHQLVASLYRFQIGNPRKVYQIGLEGNVWDVVGR